jgi:hypothetical protein
MENKNDHGDTEGTEFHGEKEEHEPVKDVSPSPPLFALCPFSSVQLRALRVSVVTLFFYDNLICRYTYPVD